MSGKKYTPEEVANYTSENNIVSKTCAKCKKTKELDMFSKDLYIKDGKQTRCNMCRSTYKKEFGKVYTQEEVDDYISKNNIILKRCSICKEEKELNLFYKSKRIKDGVCSSCKKCDSSSYIYTIEEINNYIKENSIIDKMCTKCKCIKKIEAFSTKSANKDGKHNICKSCLKACSKNNKSNYTEKEIEEYIKHNNITSKICSRCEEEKDLSLFYARRSNKSGKRSTCKDCDNILEKDGERSKKRFEKTKNDPCLYIRSIVSFSISRMLKLNNSSKKRKSCLNYLPYTIEDLKQHIESLFEPWMNWNNRGQYKRKEWDDNDQSTWRWQLDHIIPQSNLPYTSMEDDNFKKCWDLSNLRPLSAKQNVLDGANKVRHKNE